MQRFTSIQNRRAAQVTQFTLMGFAAFATIVIFCASNAMAITVAPGAATVSSAARSTAATVAPAANGKVLIPPAPGYNVTSVVQAPPTVIGAPAVAYSYGACGVPTAAYPTAAYPSASINGVAPVFGTSYAVAPTIPGAYSPGCITAPPPVSTAQMLGMAAAGCSMAAGGLGALAGVMNAADQESMTPHYEPSWSRSGARSTGRFIASNSKGCDMFIDKQGKVGPWGSHVLAMVREHRDVYLDNPNVPADAAAYCKDFNNFNPEQKERFWVNFFSAVASPESSCQPNAPNGGLFQILPKDCPGVSGSNSSAIGNTNCAMSKFTDELTKRGKMMSMCSNVCSQTGFGSNEKTVWGTLRVDDEHSGVRQGDVGGAKRTRCIIRKFPDCNNPSSVTSGDACGAPASASRQHVS